MNLKIFSSSDKAGLYPGVSFRPGGQPLFSYSNVNSQDGDIYVSQ